MVRGWTLSILEVKGQVTMDIYEKSSEHDNN